MSSYNVKTTYNTEGSYGSVETHNIYAHHNNSTDYVTFYDENGDIILVVPDTLNNNIIDAINRLYVPYKDNNTFKDNIEKLNEKDKEICGLR